ncbi:hypothetical protein A3K64_02090 [Candidatus Micrarchaeota archaeon RBG_16_36_9]|nr:MAG: hypothetical protein A3K64_02090 [Candidatus Micrarchaeota archaeon RBG_16_36_9]
MKILIKGVGRLGSQVAFLSMIKLKPEKILLSDIKDLNGDILDLNNAANGLNIKTEITDKLEPTDYLIICAGVSRNLNLKDFKQLYLLNEPIITNIITDVKPFLKKDTKIIVMTNPVNEITDLVKKLLPDYYVSNTEEFLLKIRNGKELGWEIIKTKGYTNFGPAVSAILLIEKLEEIKHPV